MAQEMQNQDHQAISTYDSVLQDAAFSSEDEEFWWLATAPSLSHLLESCQYTREDQLNYLRWYRSFIAPAFGPRPRLGLKPLFQPCPVYDGSACELSINWKESSPTQTVRFTMEATGYQAGTALDPFNQEETRSLLSRMASEVPSLDLYQFEKFAGEFFLSRKEAEAIIPKIPPGTPLSQAWLAFDLEQGSSSMAKVYFMPILKWLQTGIPTNSLVFDAVRRCGKKDSSYDASVAILDRYIKTFPPNKGPVVEMVAIDCVDSPNSRIKIYLRTTVTTLAQAKETYTLGSQLSGQTVETGLKALSELWPILFRLEDKRDMEHTEVLPNGSYCGFAIEMRAGQEVPEIKIHIPVRKIGGTDAQLCQSLSTCPNHDIKGTNGTHTFVSFTYTQRTGCYMTMYYSTKILGVQLKQDHWEGYDNLWEKKWANHEG
ncbi:tryptophan dimethylallyltransferase-domain-containing protein [Echria macrotheca]|uniref:Tryptophan dimethylallyltransferase-domain-containing protein n=1 Tax=Echria macrotheca TaxID=438768 RepID=A0AAJ0BGX6_9PEZI|nr:tryptophan dimethylallyltransferase-domain-containing protein [Echria macrotheca]